MHKRHFSVATSYFRELHPVSSLFASATNWLVRQQNNDGTWGGSEVLDRFITTNHAVMALLSTGFSPNSRLLSRGIEYLANINKEELIFFFWRAGTLLNIDSYSDLVKSDMEYMWTYRRRLGVHKDYPIPFFLFKLYRFADPHPKLSFSQNDVLKWIREEWNDNECWYGRTSITSMALALVHDLRFKDKSEIIHTSRSFLENSFVQLDDSAGYFHTHGSPSKGFSGSNIVDNCYIVFNLCESNLLDGSEFSVLRSMVQKCVSWIIDQCQDGAYWRGMPPFGGKIGDLIYPTAVSMRALLSSFSKNDLSFINQVFALLLDEDCITNSELVQSSPPINPFWGEIGSELETDLCFVLMPFSPENLTEIYLRYIKTPIQSNTNLKCMRADDIYQPSEIMKDIWVYLNKASIIIADLTYKNANVFYELGMAHVLGKKVILIAQSIEDIPFDLRGVRTIIYDNNLKGYDLLSSQLLKYINSML